MIEEEITLEGGQRGEERRRQDKTRQDRTEQNRNRTEWYGLENGKKDK